MDSPINRPFRDAGRPAASGYSLVEILVALGVILTLVALVFPISRVCQESARSVREMSGAKHAVAAWMRYAADNDGRVLVGYTTSHDPELMDARNARNQVPSPLTLARRYVFRLAPYLEYELKGSLLVNKQAGLKDDYTISVQPSFGLNATYLGGDYSSGSDREPTEVNLADYGKFVVTRLPEIFAPTRMIVFASARMTDGGVQCEGYNLIRAPYRDGRIWPPAYSDESADYTFGYLHLRFARKAVCAMADGHVEMLDYEQLSDMRRWSNLAAESDNPAWTFQKLN